MFSQREKQKRFLRVMNGVFLGAWVFIRFHLFLIFWSEVGNLQSFFVSYLKLIFHMRMDFRIEFKLL